MGKVLVQISPGMIRQARTYMRRPRRRRSLSRTLDSRKISGGHN